MDQSTDKKHGGATRDDAASLVEALTKRAVRLAVLDARFLALGGAGLATIVAAFLTSKSLAATTGLLCYAVLFWGCRYFLLRRAPNAPLAARRIETRFSAAQGAVTAALEDIGDSELAVETRRLATSATTAISKLSDEELYGVLFGFDADAESTERRARRRAALRRVSTTLAGIAVATLGAVAFHDALFSPDLDGRRSPVAASAPSQPSPQTFTLTPRAASEQAPDAVESPSSTETLGDGEEQGVDIIVAAVAALVSDLERARNLSRRLLDELDEKDSFDAALVVALARELDGAVATLDTRAATVADAIRGDKNAADAARVFLTARRAFELAEFFKRERDATGTLTSALDASLRGTSTAFDKAVDALAERLASEVHAFSILEESWRFRVEENSASELDAATRREATRLLSLRAGIRPGEASASATRDFFELINRHRDAWTDEATRYEETRRRLEAPESTEFVAFARRAASDAGLTAFCLEVGDGDAAGYLAAATRRLDDAENEARLERWGRVASILEASPSYESRATTSEVDALAARLTFGTVPASGAAFDVEPNVGAPDAPDFAADGTRDGKFQRADEKAVLDAFERAAASASAVAIVEGDAASRRRKDGVVEGGIASGDVSETGAVPDSQFAGGGERGEGDAARRVFSGDAFFVELPQDERKRLEKAQKWRPPEEYLRRAEVFRKNLQQAISEEQRNRRD